MDAGSALVGAAAVAAAAQITQTLLTRKKLTRIEAKTDRIEDRTTDTSDQVRTRNGRTLAQTVEDQTDDIDEMRGDVMELAIQFARHMGDDHSHSMVNRMRQGRRDREETARTIREIKEGDERAERRRLLERRTYEEEQ
ncbi:MAG: hypothetical protein QOG87_409 [Actinomycetota bacterium]